MMTTKEIAIALNLPANTDKDYLFDLEESAINHDKRTPHSDRLVQSLIEHIRRRQMVRIVRYKYLDGTIDPDKYYVYRENILDPDIHKFERLLFPTDNDHNFERLYDGHGLFLHVKHPLNGSRSGQSDPRNHFSNWDKFPELHNIRVFFFDGCDDDHGSPVPQDVSKYIL